jgi:hypothetical protein
MTSASLKLTKDPFDFFTNTGNKVTKNILGINILRRLVPVFALNSRISGNNVTVIQFCVPKSANLNTI